MAAVVLIFSNKSRHSSRVEPDSLARSADAVAADECSATLVNCASQLNYFKVNSMDYSISEL